MAVSSAGFKQQCPTCETMVLIKDIRQVGKKMECPKCKDRFIVENPDDADDADDKPQAKANGKAKTNGKPNGKVAPAGKTKRFREDEEEDDDAGEEAAPAAKNKGKGKYRDEEGDDDEAPAKKKGGAGSKKMLPYILAGVGLVVLIVAAVLIMMMGGSSNPPPNPAPNPNPMANSGNNPPNPGGAQEQKKDPQPGGGNQQPSAGGRGLPPAGPELTNLLPNDTEHVLHVNFKEVYDASNPYRDLIFSAGTFQDADLTKKLGFSLTAMDALIRADRYTAGGWTYTLLHFTETVDQKAITQAFGLTEAAPVNNLPYFRATRPNPWFNELSRLSLGVASSQRMTAKPDRPMCVRFHNAQTVIVGDETPIVALLKANNQFKLLTDVGSSTPASNQPTGGPLMPMQPGGPMLPGGAPMLPMPGGPMVPMGGPGAAAPAPAQPAPLPLVPNKSGVGDDNPFGEPQTAQVAPSIIAPPLEVKGGSQGPLPGGGPMGVGPMGMGPMGMPGMPGANQPAPSGLARSESWLTIDPALKALMDRMEYKAAEAKDKVYFASATDMISARIDTSRIAELRDRVIWHPRQLWDVILLLQERKARIKALGTALVQREPRVFQYRSELVCAQDGDARDLQKDLVEKAAPQIATAFNRLLNHSVEIPKTVAPPSGGQTGPGVGPMGGGSLGPAPMGGGSLGPVPMGGSGPGPIPGGGPMGGGSLGPAPMGGGSLGPIPGGGPMGMGPMGMGPIGMGPMGNTGGQQDDAPKSSRLRFAQRGGSIDLRLDLIFSPGDYVRLNNLLAILAVTVKSEVDLAGGAFSRHDLAQGVKTLGERGLSDRGVAPGRYPPAALKRAGASRAGQQPYQRMSWITGLLPYMGHDGLYQKIDFDNSWQDPRNWLAARTIVPQLLDPRYPDAARFTTQPELGVEMATTHFVGIAGVGLDAADFARGDPATMSKRGVFGYDGSAALDEISKGRGLSNTAVMIQIPHDGPTGVSPWMAGGGATVRGVPEKNSIAPFVLSNDKNGKPILHQGKRGTYVAMADGSVRFVSANVSDEVFKAMCTVQGPAPKDFDLFKNPDTPLVAKEAAKVEAPRVPEKAKPVPPTPVGQKSADWITYNVPGAGFSLSLPGNPQVIEQPTPDGRKAKIYLAVDPTTQAPFMVLSAPLNQMQKTDFASNSDKFFRDSVASAGNFGLEGIQEKRVTLGTFQGREVSMREPKSGKQSFVRIFVIGDNMVIVNAMGDQATATPQIQAFFDSMKLSN